MQRSDLPIPTTGIVATHFVVARDVETTAHFYSEVLGGQVVWRAIHPGAPTYVKFANIWIGINLGGGPTPDKPAIVLAVAHDADRFDSFLKLRVADTRFVVPAYESLRRPSAQCRLPIRGGVSIGILMTTDSRPERACDEPLGTPPIRLSAGAHGSRRKSLSRTLAPRSTPFASRVRCLGALGAGWRSTALGPGFLAAGPASTDPTPLKTASASVIRGRTGSRR